MRCFVCGGKTTTQYHFGEKDKQGFQSIVAVSKQCNVCDWHSYPTKLPKPIK